MADVKWIKITTDVFDDDKILLIESLPEADSIIVIWFKLLCLAGKQNNSGVFIMGERIAYTDKMLATIFRRKESTVQLALQTFEQFGMIELVDGVITIPNWEKHQNLDRLDQIKEQTRLRVAKHREKQKCLSGSVTGSVTDDVTVTHCNAIDKIRKDKNRKEEEKNNKKEIRHKYGEYENVLLSDSDLEKLKSEFPFDYESRIENLSSYIASTGKTYKNHLATIRNWARKEEQQPKSKPTSTIKRNYDLEAAKMMMKSIDNPPKTAADDENIRARAEALKQQFAK